MGGSAVAGCLRFSDMARLGITDWHMWNIKSREKHISMSYVTLLLVINLLVYPLHLDGQRKKNSIWYKEKVMVQPSKFWGLYHNFEGVVPYYGVRPILAQNYEILALGSDLCSQHLIVHLYFKPLGERFQIFLNEFPGLSPLSDTSELWYTPCIPPP